MATVSHFQPQAQIKMICCKGDLHTEQQLNLVCLDSLCRSSPLACAVCFASVHKYHKVVSVNKFMDDYRRNIAASNRGMLQGKISKHYSEIKSHMAGFKADIVRRIDDFEKALEKYAEYLVGQSLVRTCVSEELDIELEPVKLSQLRCQDQLQKSIRFIINNSLYDSNTNMIKVTEVLKQNEDRVSALLDKMVYMTSFCQKSISEALNTLKFANTTLKEQKSHMTQKINQIMGSDRDPRKLSSFTNIQDTLGTLVQEKSSLILEQSQKVQNLHGCHNIPRGHPEQLFGKYRHNRLQLKEGGRVLSSTINANKPQFGLAWPDINTQPQGVKQWSMKVNKCRDFASQNTMAVGIARLSDMQLAQYSGNPTNCLLVNSQGYVTLNNSTYKTSFTFREGDTLYFRYDPYYHTFDIWKQNGRKLSLKSLGTDQPVYACVRFTYASDQVQFV